MKQRWKGIMLGVGLNLGREVLKGVMLSVGKKRKMNE